MKRILFLTTEYPPFKGGVGRFVYQLANHLHEDSRTIVADRKPNIDYPRNVTSVPFDHRWVWPGWLPVLFFVYRMLKRQKHDHIVVSSVIPLGTIAYILGKLFYIPYSVVVVGLDVLDASNSKKKSFLAKLVFKNAHSVIACSSAAGNLARRFSVDEYKLAVIHPLPFITPEETDIQPPPDAIADFVNQSPTVVSTGRLVDRKNYTTLLSVAKRLADKNINWCIIGDGPQYPDLQKQINTYGLSSRVKIFRGISDKELAWIYTKASIMVFIPYSTENDFEGFGLAAVEGAFFGLPVIASNQGGVPDAIVQGQSGFLVDPRDEGRISELVLCLLDNESPEKKIAKTFLPNAKRAFSKETQKDSVYKALSLTPIQDISVIIPAHNSENTITICLQSLFEQSLIPKEVIVVDDGSTDETANNVKRFPQVKLIREKQSGAPAARNRGALEGTGNFLLFLDADIKMNPSMLKTMRLALDLHQEALFAYSQFYFGWKKFKSFSFDRSRLERMNYIHTSSLIRRSAFPGFDESLKRHQDWDLWLTVTKLGARGQYIPEVLYKITTEKVRISSWVPSFVYTLPFAHLIKRVSTYKASEDIIKKKHHLS